MKWLRGMVAQPFLSSPSMRREWIEIHYFFSDSFFPSSPSMRREWIEMFFMFFLLENNEVSLHAEGVD